MISHDFVGFTGINWAVLPSHVNSSVHQAARKSKMARFCDGQLMLAIGWELANELGF